MGAITPRRLPPGLGGLFRVFELTLDGLKDAVDTLGGRRANEADFAGWEM